MSKNLYMVDIDGVEICDESPVKYIVELSGQGNLHGKYKFSLGFDGLYIFSASFAGGLELYCLEDPASPDYTSEALTYAHRGMVLSKEEFYAKLPLEFRIELLLLGLV